MPKVCDICGKGFVRGYKYKRRGAIKRTGGAGAKIVGKMIRHFRPNLQRIKINLKGTIKTAQVCTNCIKGGEIVKA